MNLASIIKESKIEIVNMQEQSIFGDCQYEFYKCRRKVDSLSFSNLSDYYIVRFKDEEIRELFSYEKNGFENFQEFQQKLLSTNYFKNKNDLRWNLYLILIIDDSDVLSFIPTNEIENDENYARKYFFTLDELQNFLNKANIFTKGQSNNNGGLQTDQLQKWINILNDVQLTGCISNKFSSKSFEDYLYNEKPFQDAELISKANINKRKNTDSIPKKITKVQLGKFRSHCFPNSLPIEPELVNLIHGTNGCGKTSFLEAIEFSITNEIKRLKVFGENFRNFPTTSVECETNNKVIKYESGLEPSYYKTIDNSWYGVPIGSGKSTLNESFGRFNYFDSDTAFKFALEESKGDKEVNNYADKFAKLFFDDSIVEMQKQWNRYLQEFESHFTKLKKKITEDEGAIRELQNSISTYKHTEDFNEQEINQLLEKVEFRTSKIDLNESDNILSHYQAIYECFITQDQNVVAIKDCDNIVQPNNIENIKLKKEERIREKESVDLKYQSEVKKKAELEAQIKNLNNMIVDKNSQQARNNRGIKYCTETLKIWESIKNIISQPDKIDDTVELKKKINLSEKKVALVSTLNKSYPNIISLLEEDILGWSEEEIKSDEREFEIKIREYKRLQGAVKFAKSQFTRVENLKSELKKLANEYLSENINEKNCPLCGTDYSTNEKLRNKINEFTDNEENGDLLLGTLQKDKYELGKLISELKEKIEFHKQKQKLLTQLTQAFDNIKHSDLFNVSQYQTTAQILECVKAIMKSGEQLETGLLRLNAELKALEEVGFTDDNVKNYKEFIGINKLYSNYKNNDENNGGFENYVVNQKNMITLMNREIEEEIAKNQDELITINTSLNGINENELREKSTHYTKDINTLDNALVRFKQLLEYFDIQNISDFKEWNAIFETAKTRCSIAAEKLKEQNQLGKYIANLDEKTESLKSNKKTYNRCTNALHAFVQMPLLDTAVSDFIQKNWGRIEYLFKTLHRPKEFLKLQPSDDGGILALRGSDRKWVKAHQMSTGQRVSLALAVMFSLYLASNNAPSFILLDEPVANLDDLHMLNLLDIIRELALQGTQIFFTTANPDIALLFRRKFSFFGNHYKHFNFVRYNERDTKIYESLFNPNYEEHVSLREIV